MGIAKKTLLFVIMICSVVIGLSFYCGAEFFPDFGQNELADSLDDETKDLLELFGIKDFSGETLEDVSVENALKYIVQAVKSEITQPLGTLLIFTVTAVLTSVCEAFSDGRQFDFTGKILACVCTVTVFARLRTALETASFAVNATVKFINALIPVLALITAVSGKSLVAAGYTAVSFSALQIISFVSGNILPYLTDVMLALALAGSFSSELNAEKITTFLKKASYTVLGLAGVVFSGICAVKGAGGNVTDSIGLKGFRFILGSTVPVIGGNISETFNSVLDYAVLMKNTVGILSVIAVVCINAMIIIRLFIWKSVFGVGKFVFSLVNKNTLHSSFDGLTDIVDINISVLFFFMYLCISSIGMLILIVK